MPRLQQAALLLLLLLAVGTQACTTIVVGPGGTADGSVLIARNGVCLASPCLLFCPASCSACSQASIGAQHVTAGHTNLTAQTMARMPLPTRTSWCGTRTARAPPSSAPTSTSWCAGAAKDEAALLVVGRRRGVSWCRGAPLPSALALTSRRAELCCG